MLRLYKNSSCKSNTMQPASIVVIMLCYAMQVQPHTRRGWNQQFTIKRPTDYCTDPNPDYWIQP